MKKYWPLHYWNLRRLKSGITFAMSITWDCNLKCPYCSITMATGKMPIATPVSLTMNKALIINPPWPIAGKHIKEVLISGGAPELYPDFVEFVTWLLKSGRFVHINTNLLFPNTIARLPKSRRIFLTVTYHHQVNPDIFYKNYQLLVKHYQMNVYEIADYQYSYNWHPKVKQQLSQENQKYFSFSRLKPLLTLEDMQNRDIVWRVGPDHKRIVRTCLELCK